jgi:hypothetical protein
LSFVIKINVEKVEFKAVVKVFYERREKITLRIIASITF